MNSYIWMLVWFNYARNAYQKQQLCGRQHCKWTTRPTNGNREFTNHYQTAHKWIYYEMPHGGMSVAGVTQQRKSKWLLVCNEFQFKECHWRLFLKMQLSTLVQVNFGSGNAWRRIGAKPLPEPMITSALTYTWAVRSPWVTGNYALQWLVT